MLLPLLALVTCAAAAPLAGVFHHSSHQATLTKRQGIVQDTPIGLRRRGKPYVSIAEEPKRKHTIGFNIQGNGSAIDSFYYAKVWVGTPPSVFNLIIDTGSSDMILPGEACTSCNHKTLGPLSSSTFVGSAVPWNITYNNGQASGTLATDTVTVADLTLVNHNFGVILASASGFNLTSFAYDGVLGTGPSFASQEQAATVPQAIFSRRLASGVTGYRLGRSQDPTNIGEITFGGVNTAAFVKPVVTLPNVIPWHWGVVIEGASAGGDDLKFGTRQAILDTGTSQIVMPSSDAAAIHAAVTGAHGPLADGTYAVPCRTALAVVFVIGGVAFDIDPRDMILQEVSVGGTERMCISGVVADDGMGGLWLVGDVFLKNVYHATSIETNSVMIAPLAHPKGK